MKNKKPYILFINSLIIILFSALILYYPFFRYEYRTSQYKIDHISYNNKQAVDFYNHTDSISVKIAENSLKKMFEFQDKKCSFEPINLPLNTIFSSDYNFDNRTQNLYVQSLTILFDLVRAHKVTSNEALLELGKNIIKQWFKINTRSTIVNNEFSWNDHASAIRIVAILYFWDYFSEFRNDITLTNIIQKITNETLYFLLNPYRYTQNHNHGIFQDIALLYIALHIQNDEKKAELIYKSIERAKKQFFALTSDDGITLENSPGYHYVITNLLDKFLELIPKKYKVFQLYKLKKKLLRSFKLFLFYDNTLPEVGDTDPNVKYESFPFKPVGKIISSESGFLLFKNYPQYYFLGRTQSIINNHRHNDSFSFIFNWNTERIISECGFLNYENSFESKYTKTRNAHSTIVVKEISYKDFSDADFENYIDNKQFFYVKINGTINGLRYIRSIIYFKKAKILLINDKNLDSKSISRIFHLSKDIKNISQLSKSFELLTKKEETIYVNSALETMKLLFGDNKFSPSYTAIVYDSLRPSYSIYQTSNQNNLQIAFSKNKPISFNIKNNIMKLKKGKYSYNIQSGDNTIIINKQRFEAIRINKRNLTKQLPKRKYWPTHFYATKLFKIIIFVLFLYFMFLFVLKKIIKHKIIYIFYIVLPYCGLIILMLKILY